jgi:hypothetical protein
MRIEIKSEERSFSIILPTGLILNPLGFVIGKKFINIEGIDLSAIKGKDISKIAKIVKRFKKENPDWYLVDIMDSDGDTVKIKL